MRLRSDLHTEGLVSILHSGGSALGGGGDGGCCPEGLEASRFFFLRRRRRRIKTCSQIDSSANHGSAASGKSLDLSVPHFPPLQGDQVIMVTSFEIWSRNA